MGLKQERQESRAIARKPRDAAAVLFGFKFADNIRYTFKSSQASKLESPASELQTYRRKTDGHSRSFKVTCIGVSGKALYKGQNNTI